VSVLALRLQNGSERRAGLRWNQWNFLSLKKGRCLAIKRFSLHQYVLHRRVTQERCTASISTGRSVVTSVIADMLVAGLEVSAWHPFWFGSIAALDIETSTQYRSLQPMA